MLNEVNNFKIFRIFTGNFIFLFCELCKRINNTFMLKVGSFTVYFKIMPFWVTSWPFKKVSYDIALTCNYSMPVVIWWCFCNTQLLYSDKLYCIRGLFEVGNLKLALINKIWIIFNLIGKFFTVAYEVPATFWNDQIIPRYRRFTPFCLFVCLKHYTHKISKQ